LAGARRPHDRYVLVLADLHAHTAQRAHELGAHVVLTRELVRQDDDVGQRRVPSAELLPGGGPNERFAFAVSLDSRLGRTRAPAFRSLTAWSGPAPTWSPCRPA